MPMFLSIEYNLHFIDVRQFEQQGDVSSPEVGTREAPATASGYYYGSACDGRNVQQVVDPTGTVPTISYTGRARHQEKRTVTVYGFRNSRDNT
jgi:hypothetical protein